MVLDLDKKSSFLNWKLASAQKAFLDGHQLTTPGPFFLDTSRVFI
ncbi:MAG: hypothetical protein R6V25_12160 [Desulfatiglandales bacterium]